MVMRALVEGFIGDRRLWLCWMIIRIGAIKNGDTCRFKLKTAIDDFHGHRPLIARPPLIFLFKLAPIRR